VRVIGLMSGTSADGVDAALVEWEGDAPDAPFRLRAFREEAFPAELQRRVHRLAAGHLDGGAVLKEYGALDVVLADRFADAAAALAAEAGIALADVDAIASHGQTVGHYPAAGATLQIGDPSRIAERTGVTTVADFRPRDLAAGGEGAPLAPFFHRAAFADADASRVVLNLGGIANVTWLPRGGDPDAVIAFDVGPANALVDGVVQELSHGRERMDVDGARAARGRADPDLLARLLDDDYLRRPPPKSTGRERYGADEAAALAAEWRGAGRSEDDLVATLVAFTAEAVVRACRDFLADPREVDALLVCGGGSRNPAVMRALAERFPDTRVAPTDAEGVPAAAVEAMAFALMGRNALLGLPNHLPRTTGAHRAAVLGEITPGRNGLPFPTR
jgi:anhydro-N-acetylmuramic acid kinase